MTINIEDTYQFCPRCGTEHASPGAVPFHCDQCDFAQFFGPVAAVGGLVTNDRGRLLLVRRARDPGKGLWGLPGGFVDRGETVEQALVREIWEETQLKVESMQLLMTFPNHYNYRGVISPVIDSFYVCQILDTSQLQLEQAELDDFVWTIPTHEHLDQMAFASNRRAIEVWLNGRS